MDQRTQFIPDHLRDARSITALCGLCGSSRKAGYKWIDRYVRHGPGGVHGPEEDQQNDDRPSVL